MKWILAVALCLVAMPVWAAPYLVCDTYPSTATQPDVFVITEGAVVVTSPAQKMADNSVRLYYDVGGYANGNHNVTVKARKTDPVYGVLESAATPFVFTKPNVPLGPEGLTLIP